MKEAIRMVLESIYDPEFPDIPLGSSSALRRIKEEWGTSRYRSSSRWFLEFDIRKKNISIDRHRFISILKEEIDDPKFFYSTKKMFSAGRLVGGEKGPDSDSVPHSVLLSALPGNIYLHKLDQEIGRIRQKHEITLVLRIRSVLLRTGRRIDYQENSGKSFNAPQDNRAIMVGRVKSSKATFHSLSWHTPPTSTPRGDQKTPFPSAALAAFLNKPSSLLCAAFLIDEAANHRFVVLFLERKKTFAMIDLLKSSKTKRRGLLIELGGEAILVLRSERARKLSPSHDFLIKICYARYADDLLLGIVGALELLIEIQKRITHFLQSGLNLWSAAIAARSTVEFPGTVIREVPPRTTPIKFLRELEKRLRVKHRIHRTACHLRSAIHSKFRDLGSCIPIKQLTKGMSGRGRLLDAVKLAETLGTAGVRSPPVSVLWGTVKHIRQRAKSGRSNVPSEAVFSRSGMNIRNPAGRKAAGGGHWAGSFSSELPIQIEAPIKKILRRLRDRGLISGRRPRPIHVASLTNVSDGDIVNRSAGIAISPLSYYRCRDNLDQVRTIVDHQIRWSAIFTLAHKHKSSARNIIPKYPKDSNLV
uniref:Maturase n=1 Tax=Gastrodia sp. BS-2023 TaxID=3076235 RepID=A0AA95Z3C2_9ASPA|nr:maturase [Gastrodia shimizuana]WNH36801.1 maturase [Gastrodia sp. BS-2023]WOE91439.1 maturase [Gastrodia flexistyla]